MRAVDKVMLVVAAFCMLMVLWHTFAPRDWQIEGFWGLPLIVCLCIVGYGIGGYSDK